MAAEIIELEVEEVERCDVEGVTEGRETRASKGRVVGWLVGWAMPIGWGTKGVPGTKRQPEKG